MELIRTEYFYTWGFCPEIGEALPTIAVSIAVVVTLKIAISFIIYLRKNDKKEA